MIFYKLQFASEQDFKNFDALAIKHRYNMIYHKLMINNEMLLNVFEDESKHIAYFTSEKLCKNTLVEINKLAKIERYIICDEKKCEYNEKYYDSFKEYKNRLRYIH